MTESNTNLAERSFLIADADSDWAGRVGRWAANRRLGLRPVIAGRAAEALRVVESRTVAVAVLGGALVRPDSLAVLRLIRAIDTSLPCVVVSGRRDRLTLEDALELAAFSVLPTPVSEESVGEVVCRLLRRVVQHPGAYLGHQSGTPPR